MGYNPRVGGGLGQFGSEVGKLGQNGVPINGGGTPLGVLTGSAGGAGGTGFAKPTDVNIQTVSTPGQIAAANTGVNNSLDSTNQLLAALNAGNAPQNQNTVFNQGQGYLNALGVNPGISAQGNAAASQAGLNGGLQGLDGASIMGNAMGAQTGFNQDLGNLNGARSMDYNMRQQADLSGQLQGADGVGAQAGAIGSLQNLLAQQQGLAGQYQNIANGNGPNPAQAMLNNATGQNVANQAALMAGQRGAGANVGLMARQAAQQGAGIQQQAVGQGALMEAQQRMAALGQMAGQQQAMGATNQNIAGIGSNLVGQRQSGINQGFGQGMGVAGQLQTGIGQQYGQGAGALNQLQTGVGQQFGQGASMVGQNQAQQGINAGIAQNQMGNLIGVTGQNVQGNISNAGQQIQGLGGMNTNAVNMQGNINNSNTSLANTGMQGQQAMLGGLMNGAGSAMSLGGGARGGLVQMAEGGETPYAAPSGQGPILAEQPSTPAPIVEPPPSGPQSSFGKFLSGQSSTGDFLNQTIEPAQQQPQTPDTTANAQIQAPPQMGYGSQMLYKGASSMSKGATRMAMAAAKGGTAHDFRGGGNVAANSPSEKATKPGNSYANDKVKAVLSEGEVVIPRSVMQSQDPVRGAADFVMKVLAKRKVK